MQTVVADRQHVAGLAHRCRRRQSRLLRDRRQDFRRRQLFGTAGSGSGKSRDIDVRLQDIDAPEKSQAYGNTARAALVDMIADRDVFVDVIDTDRYGRKIVRVFREPDRPDVIKALVRDGHVWVYRRKVNDTSLVELEDAAREARRGLWSLPDEDLMPPWQYRYLRRKNRTTSNVLFLSEQRSWHLERTQSGDFHEAVAPVPPGVVVSPRSVRTSSRLRTAASSRRSASLAS